MCNRVQVDYLVVCTGALHKLDATVELGLGCNYGTLWPCQPFPGVSTVDAVGNGALLKGNSKVVSALLVVEFGCRFL